MHQEHNSATTGNEPSREFLAFCVSKEEYGIDILQVQEVRRYASVTPIANAPAFIKGVMDLRGTIVPIVDMRIKLNLGAPGYNHRTVVIVLTIDPAGIPIQAEAQSGPPALLTTAIGYALNWEFEPARLNGVPQLARFKLTMPFRLR